MAGETPQSTPREELKQLLWSLERMQNDVFDAELTRIGVKFMVDSVMRACSTRGNRTSQIGAIHMILDGTYPVEAISADVIKILDTPK